EDPSCRVLLLEAGGRDRSPFIRIPVGVKQMSVKYDWRYRSEADGSRNDAVDHWSGGRVIGGGSSVNAMLWVRGHRSDYDEWARLGCDGWDYENVLPYFKRAETFEGTNSPWRGA